MNADMQRINAEIKFLFSRRQQVLQGSDRAQQLSVTDAPMHLLNRRLDSLLFERDYWVHERYMHTGVHMNESIDLTLHAIDAELGQVNAQRMQIRDEGPVSANETLQSINHALITLLCADRDLRESLQT